MIQLRETDVRSRKKQVVEEVGVEVEGRSGLDSTYIPHLQSEELDRGDGEGG